MASALQTMIDQANHKSKAANNRVWGARANDQQHLSSLAKHVRIYMDEFRKDPDSGNTKAAFREMQTVLVLAERKLG